MKRNNISLRSPAAKSMAHANVFNEHTVQEFCDNLATVKDKNEFGPDRTRFKT